MPGGDGTGPWGLGSMTGRAMGTCAGYSVPGYANPIGGRGFGRGFGFGRGRGRGFGRGWGRGFYGYGYPNIPYGYSGYSQPYAPTYGYPAYNPYGQQPTAQDELQMLKDESTAMKSEMDAIEARISELKKQEQKK